jgi:hypothetical protein
MLVVTALAHSKSMWPSSLPAALFCPRGGDWRPSIYIADGQKILNHLAEHRRFNFTNCKTRQMLVSAELETLELELKLKIDLLPDRLPASITAHFLRA